MRSYPNLRAAAHEVYAPSLAGLGERSHLLTLEIDLVTHPGVRPQLVLRSPLLGPPRYTLCSDTVLSLVRRHAGQGDRDGDVGEQVLAYVGVLQKGLQYDLRVQSGHLQDG